MGTGKTTFGRALAKRLGREFIDLDFYITQRFRKSISDIFKEKGEEEFRRIEAEMIREAGEFEDVVISCGGGTPCFHENMEYMNSRGLTVLLTADRQRLLERLRAGGNKRPLIAGKDDSQILATIDEGLNAREPFYSQAEIKFSGNRLETRDQIAGSIEDFIAEYKDRY